MVGAVFGLLAWGGITLTREEGRIAIVWLPNAFLIAILLRSKFSAGLTYMPAAFAGNVIANFIAGDNLAGACSLGSINSLEVAIVWIGMRRLNMPRPDMEDMRELLTFSGIGGFLAPTISGLFAAILLSDGNWDSATQLWLKWSMSDGLGILLLAPMIMILHDMWDRWQRSNSENWYRSLTAHFLDWIIVLAVGLAVSIIVFGQNHFPLLFMAMPVVLLHAFRLGAPGTTISTLQIAIVGTIFSSFDLGPIHLFDASLSAQLITLQLFLFCCFCIGLPVSAALAAKDKIREALKDSNTRSKLVAQAAPIGMFQANTLGNLVYVNEGVCDMTGMTEDYLLEEGTMASYTNPAPWDDQSFEEQSEYFGLPRKFQIPFLQADGTEIWMETLDVPELSKNGKIKGYTGVIIDITESKALEEDLISARRHAEAAADSKTRFLASMSHEIRTPMNGVLGFTQLLLDSELSKEQQQQTQMILDSGNAMMRLLNDILDISKIEAGQLQSHREASDIKHVISSCVKLMAPTANQKGLELLVDIGSDFPESIVADKHHIRQVLLNLLGNAVKFTNTGKITLSARLQIDEDETQSVELSVRDTGIGIPPDRLAAIFDPFEQAQTTTAQEFGGSGLGLTISQQLAAVMGGSLSVECREGEGTTFTLRFPMADFAQANQQEDENMEIELLGKPLSIDGAYKTRKEDKGHVLLVEDHDVNQMLITTMVKRLGYQTTLAVDGADAVAKIDDAEANGTLFDLVLMDVQMPIMDGYQATRMIRAGGLSAKRLPIIAITANAYSEDVESCLAAGMQAHIAKPIMIDKLQAALHRWANPDDYASLASLADPDEHYLTGELAERYNQRKEEVLHCLTSLVRMGTYAETELQEAADHLHKLAGTAAMFGEEDLGIKAKLIENGLTQWKIEERPKKIKIAVSEFLKAA